MGKSDVGAIGETPLPLDVSGASVIVVSVALCWGDGSVESVCSF